MFTDTHLHLADKQFEADRDAVVERARAAGVTTLIEIAESPSMWDPAIRLAEHYPFVFASLGIHPHYAHEFGSEGWSRIEQRFRELLRHPKVVAVGEFGLDYFRMRNTKEQQDFLFRRQLELAGACGKPVILHCRDAHPDLQKAIAQAFPDTSLARVCPKPVGVVHCFSGAWEDAQTYLMHGFMVGIDAPVTYPKSDLLRQNVQRLPLERIVLETDAPYLPPQTHRGQRNEPAHIPAIGAEVAALKRKSADEVAKQTTLNAKALFGPGE